MIFVSIALLVVAAVALGIGIASSSVPPLVVSILATVVAAVVLWGSFVQYRKEAAEKGRSVAGLGGNQARQPGYPDVYAAVGPAGRFVVDPASVVPDDWDVGESSRAVALVSTFNLDELHELRRYEIEHAARPDVLAEIDRRITDIVEVRRDTSSA